MATKLTKDLTRELTTHKDLTVTLTEGGISLKVKRHRKGVSLTWDQLIAVTSVLNEDEMIGDLAEGWKKLGVKMPKEEAQA